MTKKIRVKPSDAKVLVGVRLSAIMFIHKSQGNVMLGAYMFGMKLSFLGCELN